jgi:RNA polymerase sigma-70 factor (ECF subfamily)
MFAVPLEEIAPIVGRSTPTARQLASRARRRLQGEHPRRPPDPLRQAKLVDAFLAAARIGDLAALVGVLDPDVVPRADVAAARLGATRELRGAEEVAAFSRRAHGATPAFIDRLAGAVWMRAGKPRVVFSFTTGAEKIIAIDLIADEGRLRELDGDRRLKRTQVARSARRGSIEA